MVATSPVHSPVHGPVQSPESRFCSIPSQMVKFSAKKISSLTLSGLSRDLPSTIFPPMLNSLSDGTLVAQTHSVKCQLSDYVFLRRVPRRTIIAKTSNLHQKVGYRQDYKYRKLHAYTPKTLTVVLSLVQTRKNQLSATGTYYRKSIHRIVSILGSTS